MNPQDIQAMRAKYGIPAEGFAKPQSNSGVTPQSRLSELDSAWGTTKKEDTGNPVVNAVKNYEIGGAKGAASTLVGLGEVTSKALSHLPGKAGDFFKGGVTEAEHLKESPILQATTTGQKIGKGAEQVAEFFIPGGEAETVEKLLAEGINSNTLAKLEPIVGKKTASILGHAASLGTKMAVRGAEGGSVIALQTGGDEEATKKGLETGAMLPVVGEIAGAVGNKLGGVTEIGKRLAGAISGRGKAVIDEIVKDPQSALEGLTGESIDTLTKNAGVLKEAAVNMKIEAGKEYNRVLNNLQSIYENEGKSFDKGTEINKITDLLRDKFGIVKAGDIAEQTGVEAEDSGKLDFESSRFIKPADVGIINRAMNAVKSFRDPLSPKTLEGLASKIDKLKGSDSEVNSVLHTITTSLRNSVAQMGEESGYTEGADLARNFAQAMDKLDDFTGKFKATAEDLRAPKLNSDNKIVQNTGKVILPETEKTKIIQDISTLFSGNKDADKDTLRKFVFGGQEVLSREAGRTLKTATEKASTKLGDLIREAVISPLLPPETIGKIVAKTTLKAAKVSKFIEALKKLEPAARGSIIELISKHND